MDKKKGIDLIKLEVLGCINTKDKESLQAMKESEENFPWKEFGEYQNLVALIPSTLVIKYPESELKDKTAMKLYKIRDEIKAKLEVKRAKETPPQPVIEENHTEEEELVLEKEEEPVLAEVEKEAKFGEQEISFTENEDIHIHTDLPEKTEPEIIEKTDIEKKEVVTPKPQLEKEQVEKIARDYVKSYFGLELDTIKKDVKKNMRLSLVFFLITIVLIVIVFFLK